MSKIITSQQWLKGLELCKKGKHKFRENSFGVIFCTRCGLLSNTIVNAPKLDENDCLVVKDFN